MQIGVEVDLIFDQQPDDLIHLRAARAPIAKGDIVFKTVQTHGDGLTRINIIFTVIVGKVTGGGHTTQLSLFDQHPGFLRCCLLYLDADNPRSAQ